MLLTGATLAVVVVVFFVVLLLTWPGMSDGGGNAPPQHHPPQHHPPQHHPPQHHPPQPPAEDDTPTPAEELPGDDTLSRSDDL